MKNLTPIKAIRAKCLDCCCFQRKEVELCAAVDCPLHEYRFGHRPKGEKTAATSAKSEQHTETSNYTLNEIDIKKEGATPTKTEKEMHSKRGGETDETN